MIKIQFLVLLWFFIGYTNTSVIRMDENAPAVGLYNASDRVVALTGITFDSVYNQTHATEVEFYNSFCGFCKRFAPLYKKYAKDLWGWRSVLVVAAIDCAHDDNTDTCRNFEIMAYPSLRYFPPFYEKHPKNLGIDVPHPPMDVGHENLVTAILNTTHVPENWPDFRPVLYKSRDDLFVNLPLTTKYLFLFYDTTNGSTVAQEVALDFSEFADIEVRQVASIQVAVALRLAKQGSLYVAHRDQRNVEELPLLETHRMEVRNTITKFLESKNYEFPIAEEQIAEPSENGLVSSTSERDALSSLTGEEHVLIVEYVKKNRDVVFQADLEEAIKYSVCHELTKYTSYTDEQRAALKHYISVLNKYSPLGTKGKQLISDLHHHVTETSRFSGKELETKIKELAERHTPAFVAQKGYIGCRGTITGRRGYTCGLWTLFHYLTVQAASPGKQLSADPLEVLRGIHGFVKHFFGCSHCSQHFQEMAHNDGIWNVKSNEDAVLWLWTAHNTVNRRLAGDDTEDPGFPKEQYPTSRMCSHCHQENTSGDNSIQWNRNEVMKYLRRINTPTNINRYGLTSESIQNEFPHAQAYTGSTNTFSDIDVRMGMLLYAFCIFIIVIAVKLFMRRGYRKKVYTHDFLGKI